MAGIAEKCLWGINFIVRRTRRVRSSVLILLLLQTPIFTRTYFSIYCGIEQRAIFLLAGKTNVSIFAEGIHSTHRNNRSEMRLDVWPDLRVLTSVVRNLGVCTTPFFFFFFSKSNWASWEIITYRLGIWSWKIVRNPSFALPCFFSLSEFAKKYLLWMNDVSSEWEEKDAKDW